MTMSQFDKHLQKLRVVILPGHHPPAELLDAYNSAYAVWKLVWSETFKELDGTEHLYADDFTRQDEWVCLFEGPACLGMCALRWVNLELEAAREDSYFKVWPAHAVAELGSRGNNVIIASYLTVHPLARGNRRNINCKDVVVALLVERLLESGADAMTGTARVDRGANVSTYKMGAQLLVPKLVFHGVEVDLVAFFADQVHASSDPVIQQATEYLWNFKRVG